MKIEMAVAVISLVTALIGLVATLLGKKQTIVIRESSETEAVPRESNVMATEEKAAEEQSLSAEISPGQSAPELNQLPSEEIHWYDRTGWLVFWFLIFYPVGFYGLTKSRTVRKGWKITIFIIFGFLFLIGLTAE